MSTRKAQRNDEVVIEMSGPGLDAFNQCFGFTPGTTTHTVTAGGGLTPKVKPMTQTEVRKQVKDNEDKIKQLILRNLKREGFKVKPSTMKLSKGHFVRTAHEGTLNKAYSLEYVVSTKDDVLGMQDMEVAGDFYFFIDELKKGDNLFNGKKCNAVVHACYKVSACMPCYYVVNGEWS